MATKKKASASTANTAKPQPLTAKDRKDLARILKKARAFKAYYRVQKKSGP
jgi:hypothetical protein